MDPELDPFGCSWHDFLTQGVACKYEISQTKVRGQEVNRLLRTREIRSLLENDFLVTDPLRVLRNVHEDKRGVPSDFYKLYRLKEKQSHSLVALALVREYEVLHYQDRIQVGSIIEAKKSNKTCLLWEDEFVETSLRKREMLLMSGFHFIGWCHLLFHILKQHLKTAHPIWLRLERSSEIPCRILHVLHTRFGGFPFQWASEEGTIHWQFPQSQEEVALKALAFQKLLLKRVQTGEGEEFDNDDPDVLIRL